jgi:hypothetical protein
LKLPVGLVCCLVRRVYVRVKDWLCAAVRRILVAPNVLRRVLFVSAVSSVATTLLRTSLLTLLFFHYLTLSFSLSQTQTQFGGNTLFQKALKDAFNDLVNRDVGKFKTADLIASFCDRCVCLRAAGVRVGCGVYCVDLGCYGVTRHRLWWYQHPMHSCASCGCRCV